MADIFISYRREDSEAYAGRLFDRLKEHFGKEHVFMDIIRIEPGADFVESIEKALDSCDAFLVVIGKQWLNISDESGGRRLDNSDDFIRIELATALHRNIRVIPLLVDDAGMPSAEDLPEDLKKLARRQAYELSDSRWDYDVNYLIEVLSASPRKKDRSPIPLESSYKGLQPRSYFVTATIIFAATALPFWFSHGVVDVYDARRTLWTMARYIVPIWILIWIIHGANSRRIL